MTITFVVTAPGDTDPDAKLYLAGSLAELGSWKADGLMLRHQDDGIWRTTLRVTKNAKLEYKITGGSWETVEKDQQGNEIDNRKLDCDADKQEKVIVLKFNTAPTTQPATPIKRASSKTGDIREIAAFGSKILNNERTIWVWCPPGYESATERYPVLYMHDGQNVFDDATSFAGEWRADETAGELIAGGKIQPIIIVAVANHGVDRNAEYTPTRDATESTGGNAKPYGRFLVEELKPYIDSHFRTKTDRANTGVCGSSLGGLVSLYLCDQYPETFGLCAAMSPSLWWDKRSLMTQITQSPKSLASCRVWLDMGTAEGSGVEPHVNVINVQELSASLEKAGMKLNGNLQLTIDQGKAHNEAAWAGRFGNVLTFFFAK